MHKLLTAYRAAPSPVTARRLLAHIEKHPMALCMATSEDMATISAARAA